MRYLGGKTRGAKAIVAEMLRDLENTGRYWEPFLGAGAVAAELARQRPSVEMHLSDAHPDLMLMWEALLNEWNPPTRISKRNYDRLRQADPSALRGWIGFAASYNGKWWGGYGPRAESAGRDYLAEAQRLTLSRVGHLVAGKVITLRWQDYTQIEPVTGDVVYLDPPYANSEGYAGVDEFDHQVFWNKAQEWSTQGVEVFVSEFEAPNGWTSVLNVDRVATVAHQSKGKKNVEGLFRWDGDAG